MKQTRTAEAISGVTVSEFKKKNKIGVKLSKFSYAMN